MAHLTEAEATEIFMGSVPAQILADALKDFYVGPKEDRARQLERATDALIEAANAIGCTVKKANRLMVLMQKTETKMAKGMDVHAKGVVARAAEADELRRKLERAEAKLERAETENLALLAQLAGLGEKPRLAAVA